MTMTTTITVATMTTTTKTSTRAAMMVAMMMAMTKTTMTTTMTTTSGQLREVTSGSCGAKRQQIENSAPQVSTNIRIASVVIKFVLSVILSPAIIIIIIRPSMLNYTASTINH